MWKLDRVRLALRTPMWRRWRWGLHLLVLFAGVAVAKLNEPLPQARAAAAVPAGSKSGANNLLRCWQYGRLILEEGVAELPAEAAANAIRLQMSEHARAPAYLVDTRTAICFIRPGR